MQVIINNAQPVSNSNSDFCEHLDENRIEYTVTSDGAVRLKFDDVTAWKIFCRKKNITYMRIANRNVFGIYDVLFYVDTVYLSVDNSNVSLMEQLDMDAYLPQIAAIIDSTVNYRSNWDRGERNRRRTPPRYRSDDEFYNTSTRLSIDSVNVEPGKVIRILFSDQVTERFIVGDNNEGVVIRPHRRTNIHTGAWDLLITLLRETFGLNAVFAIDEVTIEDITAYHLIDIIYEYTRGRSAVRRSESIARTEDRIRAGRKVARDLTRSPVDYTVPVGEQIPNPPESITTGDDLFTHSPVTIEDVNMHSFQLKGDAGEVHCHYDYVRGSSTLVFSIDQDADCIAVFHKLMAGLAKVQDNAVSILRPTTTTRHRGTVSYCLNDITPSLKEELMAKVYPQIIVEPSFSVTEEGLFVVNDLTSKPRKVTATAKGAAQAIVNVGTANINARRKYMARMELLQLTGTVDDYSYTDYWSKEMHIDFQTEEARDKFITNLNALGLEKE